jgi:hypothetical protein
MKGRKMRKFIIMVALVFYILIASLISGCSSSSDLGTISQELKITPLTSSSPVTEGHIDLNEIRIGKSFVAFLGTADLPDGTILYSTLEIDSMAVTWWPTDMKIPVKDSLFSENVYLNNPDEGPAFLPGAQYQLDIWQEGNSTNSLDMVFDLTGPPPAEPWWKQRFIWLIYSVIAIIAVIVIWISHRLLSKNRK